MSKPLHRYPSDFGAGAGPSDAKLAVRLAARFSSVSLDELGVDTGDAGEAMASAYTFSRSVNACPAGLSVHVEAKRE